MSGQGFTSQTLLARGSDVLFRHLGDETVLYEADSGVAMALDPIGSLVWRCIEEPATLEELAPDFADAFGVAQETIAADLEPLLENLMARGFIVDAEAAP